MAVEKRKLSNMTYAFLIIGLLIGVALGFTIGYFTDQSQISSLNTKVSNLQTSETNSLVSLASSGKPFAVGAAGTLTYAFGSELTNFEAQYPSITVAPPLFEGSGLVAQEENLTQSLSLEAAADTTAMPTVLFPTSCKLRNCLWPNTNGHHCQSQIIRRARTVQHVESRYKDLQ